MNDKKMKELELRWQQMSLFPFCCDHRISHLERRHATAHGSGLVFAGAAAPLI